MTKRMPILAATLVLFRPAAGGGIELLMIERGADMVFAAGAMVFPGGRIDPGDQALAAVAWPDGDPLETAARVAAVRETIEEVGLSVALTPVPDAVAVDRLRRGLVAGSDFAELLAREQLSLDPDALTLFARWCPDTKEIRNFDTFFFLARAPAGAVAEPDGGESVRAVWATAEALLEEADAGRHRIIFPTRCNLQRLALFDSLEAARRHAIDHPVERITPWIEEREGERWICIPDGRGYPVTTALLASAART